MSANLIQKIRAGRQINVQVEKFTYICRRPTHLEMSEITGGQMQSSEVFRRFVDGWQGVQEIDIAPGGMSVDVPFDRDLWMEYIADRPDHWAPIIEAITRSYTEHASVLDAALKKAKPG